MTDATEDPSYDRKRSNEEIAGDDDGEDDDANERRRARKKRYSERKTIGINSSASDISEAFFKCMDFDGNGYIEESESKILSVVAFNKTLEQAEKHWLAMLKAMDKDLDHKISKQEYIDWWTQIHANESVKEDGTFVEEYAKYLLDCLKRISSVKVAQKMCDAFFDAIDYNHDGFLEEKEVKNVSRWAFGKSPKQAEGTWRDMLRKMDLDHDSRISKEEYQRYWLLKAKEKIQPDGTFVEGYKRYLLKKLVMIKNGNHRQEQIRKWQLENPNTSKDLAPVQSKKTVAFLEETS
eukprot:scaffold3118_cov64-Cylindrotheca_fusiformis.AAC.9